MAATTGLLSDLPDDPTPEPEIAHAVVPPPPIALPDWLVLLVGRQTLELEMLRIQSR